MEFTSFRADIFLYGRNFLIALPPGPNLIKPVLSVFTNFLNKLVFVFGKPFLSSLMFARKAGAYPSGAPKRSSRLG
jgi:hypothetical protein